MSMKATNTFQGGVVQTVDPHMQPQGTLRYALNGSILFNTDLNAGGVPADDPEDGSTFFSDSRKGMSLAFCSKRGHKKLLDICPGYEIMGMQDLGYALLIISTTGSTGNGQIGMLTVKDDLTDPVYKILFDDQNDPNGDRLHIKKASEPGAREVKIVYVDENQFIKRIYFNDGFNQERAFNFMLAYRETMCNPDRVTDLSTLTPVHANSTTTCGLSTFAYPRHLSVHNMDSRMDLVFPRLKFAKRINGSLKRGVYQYAIRYVSRDGHRSVWSTLTRHIVVTGTHYPNNPEFLKPIAAAPFLNNNGFSHHNRYMSSTDNDSITEDGIQLEIKGLDTRWNGFELAYVYSKTDIVSHEANIFYTYNDNCDATPMPTSIRIDHVSHTGVPMAFEEFSQRYETIVRQEDIIQNRDEMYRLGTELLGELQFKTDKTVIKPKFRYLRADETLEPNFIEKPNPKTGKKDGDPLTNSIPVTTSVGLSNFTGSIETHEIVDDYNHYRGQQVEHLLKGYFRGETYGIGVCFRDRKGNPLFVHHIKDQTFPQQYETFAGESCSLTKLINGRWELRIMGMVIDNLRIPKKFIYDQFGKLNISGFEIVRTKRNAKILHQGVIWPVVNCGVGCGSGDDEFQPYILNKPSPFLKNKFELPYDDGAHHQISPDGLGDLHRIMREDSDQSIFNRKDAAVGEVIKAYPGYCMYASPDIMLEETFTFNKDADRLKHVGTCHKGYTRNEIPLIGEGFPTRNPGKHNYCKSYSTINQEGDLRLLEYGRPKIGAESRLRFGERMSTSWFEKKGIDPDRQDMTFKNGYLDVAIADRAAYDLPGAGTTTNKIAYGVGCKNTLFLGCTDFEHVDITNPDTTSEVSYRIVNYMRPNATYYTPDGENSFDARQYFSTGHYQPITPEILSAVEQDAYDFIFSGVEVWGGDCFVDFFDFTRVMSQAKFDCDQGAAAVRFKNTVTLCNNIDGDEDIGFRDYSYSMIIPLESKYPFCYREPRRFASSATMPQETYCRNEFLQFTGGINDKQQESFNLNRVLLHEENIQFFSVKPKEIKIVQQKPSSVYVSEKKIYSELDDSYRKQKVAKFLDLDGSAGKGVGLVVSFNWVYIFQEYAYGILRTNERAAIPTSVGEIILGTGRELAGMDYISKEIGCQHQSSLKLFKNNIYWVDARRGLVCRHGQSGAEELSDNNGMHDFFSKELPYFDNRLSPTKLDGDVDIVCGFDYDNSDVMFSFKGKANAGGPPASNITKTIAYNASLSAFHGFLSPVPHLYGTHRKFCVVVKPNYTSSLYVHGKGKFGQFFDEYKKTVMEFVVAELPKTPKVFDNMSINMEAVGVKRIGKVELSTQFVKHTLYQQQSNVFLDTRFRYREASLLFPLFEKGSPFKQRLRDHVMVCRITIDNENQLLDNTDTPVAITSIETAFRPSNKL